MSLRSKLFGRPAGGALKDTDILAYKEDGTTGDTARNHTFQVLREWLAGVLEFVSGIVLTPGRIAMQEKTSGTLTTSGWYQVAKVGPSSFQPAIADFHFIALGDSRNASFSAHAEFYEGGVKNRNTNTLEIKGSGGLVGFRGITSIRYAKTDTTNNSGGYIEVYVDVFGGSQVEFETHMFGNIGAKNDKGFELIDVVPSDGLCPDGVTPATFIEAGAELSFENTGATEVYNDFSAYKISNDQIRCSVLWPEIPKQGTGITLTPAATSTLFVDGNGTNTAALGSFTISNFRIVGRRVIFYINQTGIATALIQSAAFARITGTGCKLTITG